MNTPRTDAAIIKGCGLMVRPDFARGLELELNAARLELEQARHDRNKAAMLERQKYLPELEQWKERALKSERDEMRHKKLEGE